MSNDKKFPHYFKQIPEGVTHVDVYHVLRLFAVDDGAIAHALKKLLCAGKRGNKGRQTDISEAIASLTRCLELDALEQPTGAVGDDGPDGHEGCTGCPTGHEGTPGWCSECDPDFPCFGGTGKPCIRLPKAPKCTHENEYQCQDCMLLKCEEPSVILRDDGGVRCNSCSSVFTNKMLEEIGAQAKIDYANAVTEATKVGETLNRLSREKCEKHKTPIIQFNAIGDMNQAGVINKSRDSGRTLITSVRVRNSGHALDIVHGLDTAIRELVTFYWFNEAMGMNGKWCSYSHTEF